MNYHRNFFILRTNPDVLTRSQSWCHIAAFTSEPMFAAECEESCVADMTSFSMLELKQMSKKSKRASNSKEKPRIKEKGVDSGTQL
ncbi:hypothetical protein ACHQM5_018687 [Ranunculus cassubicifolius]